MTTAAAFILDAATAAGIKLGTNGDELVIAAPRGMPRESYFSFQRSILAHREEIIGIILDEARERENDAHRTAS